MSGPDMFEARIERALLELSAPAAGPAREEHVAAALASRRGARRSWFPWNRLPANRVLALALVASVALSVFAGLLLVGTTDDLIPSDSPSPAATAGRSDARSDARELFT
jgi:hypothetical protein